MAHLRKSCLLLDDVENCGRSRQTTDGSVLQHMSFACRMIKATDSHSECVTLITFHGKSGYANAP